MPDETMRESSVEPRGSAGLVNQGAKSTVEQVGPRYSDLAQASQEAAASKADAEWSSLMSGHTGY